MNNHKKKRHCRLKAKSATTSNINQQVKKDSSPFKSHVSSVALDSFKTIHVSEAEMKNRRKMVSKKATRMKNVLGDF